MIFIFVGSVYFSVCVISYYTLPLHGDLEIIPGPDYDILRVLVPQVVHVGGVNFDNGIASFKTSSFRRGAAVNLQPKQINSDSRRVESRSNKRRHVDVTQFDVTQFEGIKL